MPRQGDGVSGGADEHAEKNAQDEDGRCQSGDSCCRLRDPADTPIAHFGSPALNRMPSPPAFLCRLPKLNRSSVNLPVHRLLPLRETIFSPASMGEALAIASLDELSV